MSFVTRGFRRKDREAPAERVPPGQYATPDFPVLSAGPTPRITTDTWEFTLLDASGERHAWDWDAFMALASDTVTVDIHCVTKWSKLDTTWTGVPIDTLLEGVSQTGSQALLSSYGGYTTNLPLQDVTGGKAWLAHEYEGEPLAAEHGGPVRLLVPHLYFWKSAKWVNGMVLSDVERLGFWESYGYHSYGDPWREQRYAGD
ncbi:MAG TPA: molybdopterin-dependent oxidoreductase [Acidimicrobiia bacterium]|nr:molybdopterin-dependent oxidoreductase [Acidimicrobiia bacterium]